MRAEKLLIFGVVLLLGFATEATVLAQKPLLQITSPIEGTVVRPGQAITVTLAADPSLQDTGVFGDTPFSFGQSTPSPLQFTISVASDAMPGVYPIAAMGLASGVDVHADPVRVDVERLDAPQFVTAELAILEFSGVGDDAPIITYGLFNDGNRINISRSTKTIYLSNDPTVATVSNAGLVTAVAPGETTIAVNTTDCTAQPFLIRVEVPYPQPIGTSLSPAAGPVGTVVTLEGTNFGPTQGSSTVIFFGIVAVPTSWSDTKIVVPTPNGLPAGNAGMVITVNGVAGDGGIFAVIPEVISLSPVTGPTGTPLIIAGTSFGKTQGRSTVMIGGIAAIPTSWSDSSIALNIPSGLPAGNFDVTVTTNGFTSNTKNFMVAPRANGLSRPADTLVHF